MKYSGHDQANSNISTLPPPPTGLVASINDTLISQLIDLEEIERRLIVVASRLFASEYVSTDVEQAPHRECDGSLDQTQGLLEQNGSIIHRLRSGLQVFEGL